MKAKPFHVYVLRCPSTKAIRYVGKTNQVKSRYALHLNDARCPNTPVRKWIHRLLKRGAKPVMETVELWHDPTEALIAERWRMWSYLAAGVRLLNSKTYDWCPVRDTRGLNMVASQAVR